MEEQELPAGWVEVDLSEVCTKIVDGSHNPPKASPSGLPMLSARNVENRRISLEADYRLIERDDFEVENRRTQISNGDVLLTIVGAIGRTAVVPAELLPFTLQRSVAVLKPNPGISSQYLAYALESPSSQKYLVDNAKGTAQKGIYLKALGGLRLRVSPFNEQRRIAAKLDTTLAAVDACRRRLDGVADLIKRFRQAVLAAATSGELTREWRGERGINDSWGDQRVGDLLSDLRYGTAQKCTYDACGKPVLRIPNILEGSISHDDLKYAEFGQQEIEKLAIRAGDLLIIRSNGSLDLVGRTALASKADEGLLFAGYLIRLRPRQDIVNSAFLLLVLLSPEIRRRIELAARSTSGVNNINSKFLSGLRLELPSVEEQQEIVRRAQGLFTLADQLEARLNAARKVVDRLTPALLAKAFRGELVPQDPGDEPASVLLERIRAARQAEAAAGKPSRRGRKQAATHPAPAPRDAAPVPPDLLAGLLSECGALSERALLAASDLAPERFQRQLAKEMDAGGIREDLEDGERVLVVAG